MTDYKRTMFNLAKNWLTDTCYLKPDGNVRRRYSDEVNALIDSGLDQAANAIVSNAYAKIARRYEAIGEDMRHVDPDELDAYAFKLLTKTIELHEKQHEGGDHAMTDDLKGYSYCRDYLPGGIPTSRYYRDPKGDRIDDPNMIERLDALFSDRIEKEKGIQEANEEPNGETNGLLTLKSRLFGIKTDA